MTDTMLYGIKNETLYLVAPKKMNGLHGENFLTMVDNLQSKQPFATIKIDLQNCCYMDSTVMGQMISVWKRIPHLAIFLVKPSPECRQLLTIMGLQKIFEVSEETFDTQVASDRSEDLCNNQACDLLDAHRALAELSEENRKRFEIVVQTLEESIKKTAI